MNSKIEVNDLGIKEKTINKKFNDKTILKNLCDIKFNLEELDILTKEVKGDKINNNGIKEDNSLINIKLNNDEIDILFNEINNNGEYMNDKKN